MQNLIIETSNSVSFRQLDETLSVVTKQSWTETIPAHVEQQPDMDDPEMMVDIEVPEQTINHPIKRTVLSGQALLDWFLIEDGRIDPEFKPVSEGHRYFIIPEEQEVPSGPFEVTDWQTGTWEAIAPDLTITKADAIKRVAVYAQEIAERLIGKVPQTERDSWASKEAAARAHVAGSATAADTALLQAEADQTGESLDILAASIIANADLYRVVVGKLAGLRRATDAAINAATTTEAVDTILANAQQRAEAEFEALVP